MTELYFENTKTGKKYKVIKLDKTAGKILLQGEFTQFEEPYDKERFERLGYKLVKVEAPEPAEMDQ